MQLVQTLLSSLQAAEDAEPKSKPKPTVARAPMHEQRPRQQAVRGGGGVSWLLSWLAVTGAALFFGFKVALPWSRHFAAVYQVPDEMAQYGELGHKLSPLLWFAVGYSIVVALRSRVSYVVVFLL